MVAHAYRGYPFEACGLLGGTPGGQGGDGDGGGSDGAVVEHFVPCRNADGSARTYSIGPDGFLAADRALDPLGLAVIGVMHSHTHTDAYPSPTDIAKADNPLLAGWHYIIVSLRDTDPVLRSYLIDGDEVVEEVVSLNGR
jgi:proteasome lid subunit RPN8/RPN11